MRQRFLAIGNRLGEHGRMAEALEKAAQNCTEPATGATASLTVVRTWASNQRPTFGIAIWAVGSSRRAPSRTR